MNSQHSLIKRTIVATGLMLGVLISAALVQAAWVPPSGISPACPTDYSGCDTPLNIGPASQPKLGQLVINADTSNPYATGLQVFGRSVFDSIQIKNGAGNGKLLTATDTDGNAAWQSSSALLDILPVAYFPPNLINVTNNPPGGDISTASGARLSLGPHAFCALSGNVVLPSQTNMSDFSYLSYDGANWYITSAAMDDAYRRVNCFDVANSPKPVTVAVTVVGPGKVVWTENGSTCSSSEGNTNTCLFPNNVPSVNVPVSAHFVATPEIPDVYTSLPVFVGWQRACEGAGSNCSIYLTGNTTIKATFSTPPPNSNVSI